MKIDPIDSILSRLTGVRQNGNGWTAHCPAHEDHKSSLSLHQGDDGRILFHCFAGCSYEEIAAALGLEMRDLFPKDDRRAPRDGKPTGRSQLTVADLAHDKNLPEAFLRELGVVEEGSALRLTYRLADGSPASRQRIRTALAAKDGSVWTKGTGKVVPYGLWRLEEARKLGYLVLVEGESDCWTLWSHGFPALGIPGADMAGKLHAEYLTGIGKLEIFQEPDKGGEAFIAGVARQLKKISWTGETRIVKLPDSKDPNELHKREPVTFKDAFQAAMDAALPLEVLAPSPGSEVAQEVIPWPDPPDDAAYHGLAGDIVRAIEPHTEADPVALLIQFLVAFGNMVGRGPHFTAEADYHAMNLFAILVGTTSKGRKGTSWGHIHRLFKYAALPAGQAGQQENDENLEDLSAFIDKAPIFLDDCWLFRRIVSGLSSGEGLIWAVRDEIYKTEAIREKGKPTGETIEVLADPGEKDKRLLVLEAEFASTLRVLGRDGNILSATIRQAWDTGILRTLTKNNPAIATGAHISIVGHITKDELLRYLANTETGNGFANRFLWLCVKRSKFLPEGGRIREVDFKPLVERLRKAIEFAKTVKSIKREGEARKIWFEVYEELSEGKRGLLGAVTSRAEAQVMRLACVYAMLDISYVVGASHLKAALAVWEYCEASARFIFGDALGDPVADEILRALRANPQGLTRTEISDLFGRNKEAREIERGLSALLGGGLVRKVVEQQDKGRPIDRWFVLRASTK